MSTYAALPETQSALLVHGPRQKYQLSSIPVPSLKSDDEVLVRVEAIGLNPVDYKSVLYNFALPVLPALNGRDLAGTIVFTGPSVERFKVGDRVFAVSTNYRDYRTSSFQQYAVASSHCLGLVPPNVTIEQSAALGVGASTAAIALSSALGIKIRDFASSELGIGSEGELDNSTLPPSIKERDYLLVWGASCVTGYFACQFARLAGLKVIAVVCEKKHGDRLRAIGVEHVIDRHDPTLAVSQIRSLTSNSLKYAIDCVGSETAGFAQEALTTTEKSWIVGLSGLPKQLRPGVVGHSVPIKTCHSNPKVGAGLMKLIEDLLSTNELVLPEITVIEGGLEAVNDGLEKLRTGQIPFGRIVIKSN
ncbi:zinc-binding alcohol dehydrogenase family protein [Sporobolomyces salmoneus]|uniref:zinc-binding alcohol dehydrogenase family protein n=1 Tax=Sporobolomyces salmoneus TaxID=183962 RepID=UPI00317A2A04